MYRKSGNDETHVNIEDTICKNEILNCIDGNKSDIDTIEVKADKNVKFKSLKYFIDKYNSKVAYRFSLMSYEENGKVINIPLYALAVF